MKIKFYHNIHCIIIYISYVLFYTLNAIVKVNIHMPILEA